jgi:hypothetical protein
MPFFPRALAAREERQEEGMVRGKVLANDESRG